MSSDSLAMQVLKNQVQSGRLASAYLIFGEEGSRKEELAQALARALVCTRREISWSCPCAACDRVVKGNHPDILWLKREKDAKGIKIERVRQLIEWASLKPYESEWKVAVLEEAERLTEEASQALLKTLEEPPQQTLFVLLTADKARILETIQSRCFGIRLNAPESLDQAAGPATTPEETAWEQYLEKASAFKREGLLDFLYGLMLYFYQALPQQSGQSQAPVKSLYYLKAIDSVYEARSAVEANTNGKLSLTWLAIQLNRIFSDHRPERVNV